MMKRAAVFLVTVYLCVPLVIYLCPWILGHVIYSHLLKFPFFVDLSRPERLLNHTTNLYLPTEPGVSVGVWHTLPISQWEKAAGRGPEWYQEALGDGRPVIVYLHGNTGTRAIHHRVELVKILSAAGYHVLSFDYRGSVVDAVILEAPYTSIRKATECHVLAKVPLKTLESPLLVLHAEDDGILPYHMGQELYQIALQAQKGRPDAEVRVQMVSYSATLGYAHDNIYLDPNLVHVLG
ncbi:hypothetical protein CRUP_031074 [Coryphaenoides rupestris]|nr:hypothetical protein CRUP_031074 [Coryphaenoides rupestris]